jgi:hypothetical protein
VLGTKQAAALSGTVIRIGPKNVVIRSEVGFRPDGPLFVHEHKVARVAVSYVLRNKVLHEVQR